MNKLVIGTRGSRLARLQTSMVIALIKERFPDTSVEERIIVTEGDKLAGKSPSVTGDKGLFTRAIERQLIDKTIDMAVHSYKDLPTELPDGLCIGAVLLRGPVEDALIGPPGASVGRLPRGARVGAGSIRRSAQLKHLRPDLVAAEIQGNVDTRLKKLDKGDFDAIILAHAGIDRLALSDRIACILNTSSWYHAVGQGALAVEIREENAAAAACAGAFDHDLTRMQTDAERSLLKRLGGGCLVPVGVRGSINRERLCLEGMVCGFDGSPFLEDQEAGEPGDAVDIGRRLADKLLQKGAGDVLKSVRDHFDRR